MKQELTVILTRYEEKIATIYFFLPVCTVPTLCIAKELINFLEDINFREKSNEEIVTNLIEYYRDDMGINTSFSSLFFVYITKTENTYKEDLELNLSKECIYNDVFDISDEKSLSEDEYNKLPVLNVNVYSALFEDVGELIDTIQSVKCFRDEKGNIVHLIG